jgi:histidine phosphotransferase ChpT
MSNTSSRDLNALLGSRICHDLISPLGAINNGVELLTMSGINAAPEIALIAESVENANARIRFFRIAFGAASANQTVAISEIRSILADMGRGGRLRYQWEPEQDLLRVRVKLAFLLLQCFETAMPWGGNIEVFETGGHWAIRGQAERQKIEPDLWQMLVDGTADADVTPAHVHFALVGGAARQAGRMVSTDLQSGEIRVTF